MRGGAPTRKRKLDGRLRCGCEVEEGKECRRVL